MVQRGFGYGDITVVMIDVLIYEMNKHSRNKDGIHVFKQLMLKEKFQIWQYNKALK